MTTTKRQNLCFDLTFLAVVGVLANNFLAVVGVLANNFFVCFSSVILPKFDSKHQLKYPIFNHKSLIIKYLYFIQINE
jgi:hypothetical protein